MVDYNLNQPTLPEIQEKIRVAKAAREFAKAARKGKSLGFRPQVGVHPPTAAGHRPIVGRPGTW